MANIIKVKDLYKAVKAEMDKGNGDKICLVCDDDEGNGLHPMWFTLTTMEQYGITKADELRYMHLHGMKAEDVFEKGIIVG